MTTQRIPITSGRTVNSGRPIFVGAAHDNLSERVIFAGVPELDVDQSVFVAWVLNDGSEGDVTALTKTADGWAWDVTSALTQYAGHGLNISPYETTQSAAKQPVAAGYIHITAGDGKLWNTQPFPISIAPLPDASSTVTPPELSAIDQMLAAIATHNAAMAAALKAAKVIGATATTLAAGANATVTRTESADGVTLALGIPRGNTGAAGPNVVNTATDSGITGILKGSGGKVAQALAGEDYATPADVAAVTSQLADIAPTDGHSLSQRQALFGAVWDKGESPILTRVGAMSGATVAPGLDAMPGSVKTVTIDGTEVFGYNRYVAETALFDWPEVTDSYGNVFIRIPKIYLRKIDTPTSLTWYASRMPFEGCYLPKCFWDFENSRELDYVLVGKYKASLSADGLRLESKPDVFPLYSRNIVQFRTLAQANNTGGLKGYQQLDIHVIDLLQTLFVIQNATLDSQSKAAGFTAGQYSATHLAVVAEDGVNRIIVPNATANLYEVGQSIGIGTSQGGQQVAADRLITAIEVYDESNKSVVFDGAPVNIAVGNMLYNTAYKNGFSAALASKFASKISATSGKHPFVWQGIESLWGDIWQFVDGVNINNRQAWVCENADQYTSNVFAEPYKQLSYVNGSMNGYSMAMGFDAERPYASFPVSVGGSSNKFYSDYYYQNEGQRIALVGGGWSFGSSAGLFDWNLRNASSSAYVIFGGRLLRKPL